MKAAEVKKLSSMPLSSPSYPRGPYRFIDREYLIVTYESDPDAIREALPEMMSRRLRADEKSGAFRKSTPTRSSPSSTTRSLACSNMPASPWRWRRWGISTKTCSTM